MRINYARLYCFLSSPITPSIIAEMYLKYFCTRLKKKKVVKPLTFNVKLFLLLTCHLMKSRFQSLMKSITVLTDYSVHTFNIASCFVMYEFSLLMKSEEFGLIYETWSQFPIEVTQQRQVRRGASSLSECKGLTVSCPLFTYLTVIYGMLCISELLTSSLCLLFLPLCSQWKVLKKLRVFRQKPDSSSLNGLGRPPIPISELKEQVMVREIPCLSPKLKRKKKNVKTLIILLY